MKKSSLILEGGGMRGMYTSGVLDAFMDNDLYINNVYAVSAGCYNALSYLSRQKGRSYRINTTYLNDKRYINMRKLVTSGSAINTSFIFEEVFKKLDEFDYDEFKKNTDNFYAVSTNCDSGEAHYALIKDLDNDVEYVKASAALPLFTRIVKVDGLKLTDGGISDSIPIRKAIEDGFTNNVIVLTRPKGFILKDNKLMRFYKLRYKKYPNLLNAMSNRKYVYNDTLKYIEELEKNKKVFVIRPSVDLNIDNLEKDIHKIQKIYEMGYADGLKYIGELKNFLKEKKDVKR